MWVARKVATSLSVTMLAGAVILVVFGGLRHAENRFGDSVKSILPVPPPGWELTELPIANSPEMRRAVGELLNFDDAILVDYHRETVRLSVYIAYWKAGKMSRRAIAGHTPDQCWVNGGWRRLKASQITKWGELAPKIPCAQSREFALGSEIEYVYFWHLFGGESVTYGNMSKAPWYAFLVDLLSEGLDQRKEQFFIRISSQIPLDSLELRNLVLPLMERVRELSELGERQPSITAERAGASQFSAKQFSDNHQSTS